MTTTHQQQADDGRQQAHHTHAVLAALRRSPQSLPQLAQAAGLDRITTRAYLGTLMSAGYAELTQSGTTPDAKRWTLDARVTKRTVKVALARLQQFTQTGEVAP